MRSSVAYIPAEGLSVSSKTEDSEESTDVLGPQRVTVLEVDGRWAKVRTDSGVEGWVDGWRLGWGQPERGPQWLALAGGVAAAIAFFLPWLETWIPFGPRISTDSGFALARITESLASGSNLMILFLPLVAAAAALVMAAGLFTSQAPRRFTILSTIQIVLAISAVAAIAVVLPSEIDTWRGLVVEYQPGLWLGIAALGAIAASGFWGLGVRKRIAP